jgi:predicted DNA-binding ribbon-helix-helix protein
MKSMILKRSIVLAGHKTSVSLEEAFWRALKDIAASQRMTLSDLICGIDTKREYGNLSSALRLFVLNHYQARSSGLEHAPLRRAEIERVPNGANYNSA